MDNRRRAFIVASLGILVTVLAFQCNLLTLIESSESEARRRCNKRRRRDHFEEKLESWNDREFKSQTSLSRMLFNYLAAIIEPKVRKNRRMAELSSGSPISTRMRLFVFLRLAKGAKPQDMDWVGVDPVHAWDYIAMPVAEALNEVLLNINFKYDDPDWLEEQALQWSFVQKKKYSHFGEALNKGLVSAGDGFVVQIPVLRLSEYKNLGLALERFWNRKGWNRKDSSLSTMQL
jgi:hypothetical protein